MNDERALSMHKECLDGDRVFVIDDFLTPAQCRSFLEQSERHGYDEATITTSAGLVMDKEIRDNARLVLRWPASRYRALR